MNLTIKESNYLHCYTGISFFSSSYTHTWMKAQEKVISLPLHKCLWEGHVTCGRCCSAWLRRRRLVFLHWKTTWQGVCGRHDGNTHRGFKEITLLRWSPLGSHWRGVRRKVVWKRESGREREREREKESKSGLPYQAARDLHSVHNELSPGVFRKIWLLTSEGTLSFLKPSFSDLYWESPSRSLPLSLTRSPSLRSVNVVDNISLSIAKAPSLCFEEALAVSFSLVNAFMLKKTRYDGSRRPTG